MSENDARKFGFGQTLAVLLAIAVVAGILLIARSAHAQEGLQFHIPSCSLVGHDKVVECVKERVRVGTPYAEVIQTLGTQIGGGVAVACQRTPEGKPDKDNCKTLPATLHKIGRHLFSVVFDESSNVVSVGGKILTPEEAEALDRKIEDLRQQRGGGLRKL